MKDLKKLNSSELKAELEELESKYFMLKMVDTWTSEDYRYADELQQQIRTVKEAITEREMLTYGLLGI